MSKKERGDLGMLLYVSLDNFLVPAHFFLLFSPKSIHHTYLFIVQLGHFLSTEYAWKTKPHRDFQVK